MKSWEYKKEDVLLIKLGRKRVIAKIDDIFYPHDNTTPILVSLRDVVTLSWSSSSVKIWKKDIIQSLPNWE